MRLGNRLLALILGGAIAAAGLAVIVEAISAGIGSGFVWINGKSWVHSFETTAWSADVVVAMSIAVAVGGFGLLVAEFRPQRKRVVSYSTDHGTWLLLRRSAETHLQRRLALAVPVSPIKVRLKPRALRWRVKVTARAAASSRAPLRDAVGAELARLHSPKATRVQVKATGSTKASS
jgi:hypothetical protein